MFFIKWNLQLFADGGAGATGGDGGDGSATGESAVDAGQKRLRELGVPENRLKKRASRAVGQQIQAAQPKEQDAAAVTPTEEAKEEAPAKKSFKDLLAENPDYNDEVQKIIKARLKGQSDAQANLEKLGPALEVLARQHNMDPQKLDYEALAQAINNDDQFYESKALEMGTDIETAKKTDQDEREQARVARNLEEQRYIQHFQKLEQQGESLKQVFPSFDLRVEMQNPAFARMVHPNVGISVEDAYYAVHRNEIQSAAMQVTAQKTAQNISNSIMAGKHRPSEAGQTAQAPSVATFDYRTASREQREAFKKRIREAAARGEKVYPGQ